MENKLLKRVIALSTVAAVSVSAVQVSAFAMTVDDSGAAKPSDIQVEWHTPATLLGVEQNEDEFLIKTQVNGQAVSLGLSFPSLGGVRLKTEKKGFFDPESVEKISYETAGDTITMKGKDVTAKFMGGESPWALEISAAAGTAVRRISAGEIYFGYQGSELKKVKLEGSIDNGELLYGLGERFNAFDQVGESVLLWNHDSYNDLMNYNGDKTTGYKNVPVLHSSKGYMLFFNSYYAARADIGKTDSGKYSLDFNGPKFDFYLWAGEPLQNIQAYTSLTGKPVLPPKWAFEYYAGAGGQVWDAKGKGKHLDVLQECMDGYQKLGTPIAALFGEGSPSKDAAAYQLLKKTDTRMLMWYWSAMGSGDMFKYLPGSLKKDLPSVYTISNPTQVMQGEYIDFTHPKAVDLIQSFFQQPWEWGCRGCMVDFGDNVYEDSRFYNGMTGDEMHNAYAWYYNKGYHDAWEKGLAGDYVLFSRSGAAGSQQWAAQFAGDHPSTFQGLQQAVTGGLTASTAGFSVWGSDIGGYGFDDYPPTPDCYMRWLQFGAFSPLMRLHGTSDRNPWTYGEQAGRVFQTHYWLRKNLLDKIYSAAVVSHQQGVPMIQPMAVAFPQEPELAGIDDQYLFCNDFLVAPVTGEGKYYREVAFPQGVWVDLWTGEQVQGGQTQKVAAPQERMPVYLRAGAAFQADVSAETLALANDMNGGRTKALLAVAGADGENAFWADENTSYGYTVSQENGVTTLAAGQKSGLTAVLVYGASASGVTVDGKPLSQRSAVPAKEGETGFYNDPVQNRTVIRVPAGGWSELKLTSEQSGPLDLAQGKSASASSERSAKFGAANVVKNDVTAHWTAKGGADEWIAVDLGSEQTVGSVVLQWTNQFAPGYKVQVGSGNNWTDVYTQENGFGGVETISFSPVKASRVRVLLTKGPEEGNAELYGLKVFGGAQGAVAGQAVPVWPIAAAAACVLAVAAAALLLIKKRRKPGSAA